MMMRQEILLHTSISSETRPDNSWQAFGSISWGRPLATPSRLSAMETCSLSNLTYVDIGFSRAGHEPETGWSSRVLDVSFIAQRAPFGLDAPSPVADVLCNIAFGRRCDTSHQLLQRRIDPGQCGRADCTTLEARIRVVPSSGPRKLD